MIFCPLYSLPSEIRLLGFGFAHFFGLYTCNYYCMLVSNKGSYSKAFVHMWTFEVTSKFFNEKRKPATTAASTQHSGRLRRYSGLPSFSKQEHAVW